MKPSERVDDDLAGRVVQAGWTTFAAGTRHRGLVAIRLLDVVPDLLRIVRVRKVPRLHEVRPAEAKNIIGLPSISTTTAGLVARQGPVDCDHTICSLRRCPVSMSESVV